MDKPQPINWTIEQKKGVVLSASYFYPHTYNNSRICNKLPRTMCG